MKSFLMTGIWLVTCLTSLWAQSPVSDSLISRILDAFQVPGLAVSVVQDGKVVFAGGFGVRTAGKSDKVTENTVFGIASNSKAFTASALAILVDEGRISWDDPVIKHIPWFQLYDPWVTREITIRDLLCHRSGLGLGAGDLMVFPSASFKPKEIIENMKAIKPASSFRSTYAYNNLAFLVAGTVVEEVTDSSWGDFITARFLNPLGMSRTRTVQSAVSGMPDQASYHVLVDGKLEVTPAESMDNCAPAGGINSSAQDLTRWMMFCLDSGRVVLPDGKIKRIISKKQYRQLWSTQTPLPFGPPPPGFESLKTQFSGYALGWQVRQFRGYQMVSHTGGLTGMVSRITLIPEKKLGIAVLTNQESGEAFNAVTFTLLNQYLGFKPEDWTGKFKTLKDSAEARLTRELAQKETGRNRTSKPSHSLSELSGSYSDAWMGKMNLTETNSGLRISFEKSPVLTGKLEHWQYDTFVIRWDHRYLRADAFITFSFGPDGKVTGVNLEPVSSGTDFSFDFQDLEMKRE